MGALAFTGSLLGLENTAGYSPGVQELAALAVRRFPVAEASVVIERLTGVKLPRATLARAARRQGLRAQTQRDRIVQQGVNPVSGPAEGAQREERKPIGTIYPGYPVGYIKHPGARRLGRKCGPAGRWARAWPLALGLWGHLPSPRSAGQNRRRPAGHPESWLRDDARRN